jgi:hypothetical protein
MGDMCRVGKGVVYTREVTYVSVGHVLRGERSGIGRQSNRILWGGGGGRR